MIRSYAVDISPQAQQDIRAVHARIAVDAPYNAAEYLLGVVENGGIERAFETAEGMALATDQRELWEVERGLPLEPDAAQRAVSITRRMTARSTGVSR